MVTGDAEAIHGPRFGGTASSFPRYHSEEQNWAQKNGETHMTNRVPPLAAMALFAVTVASFANVASATPIADALAVKNAAPTNIETVQWRGRGGGWGRRGGEWGIGAGLFGAAIIGAALAASYHGYGYAPGSYYPYAGAYDPYAGPYGPPPGYYGRGPYWGPGGRW
jgi:hypothetical protein